MNTDKKTDGASLPIRVHPCSSVAASLAQLEIGSLNHCQPLRTNPPWKFWRQRRSFALAGVKPPDLVRELTRGKLNAAWTVHDFVNEHGVLLSVLRISHENPHVLLRRGRHRDPERNSLRCGPSHDADPLVLPYVERADFEAFLPVAVPEIRPFAHARILF